MLRAALLFALAVAAPAAATQPGDWPRTIELPTYVGEGPFVTVPANILGMPALILAGGTATLVCTPFDLLRGLTVGGGYGTVAAACAEGVGRPIGNAAYIIGGAPFWIIKVLGRWGVSGASRDTARDNEGRRDAAGQSPQGTEVMNGAAPEGR